MPSIPPRFIVSLTLGFWFNCFMKGEYLSEVMCVLGAVSRLLFAVKISSLTCILRLLSNHAAVVRIFDSFISRMQ